MNIIPNDTICGYRQGGISDKVTYETIVERLGPPNVDDDPVKVTCSWGYTVDGKDVAIWDYKGSRWSYYGDTKTLKKLFGAENVTHEVVEYL